MRLQYCALLLAAACVPPKPDAPAPTQLRVRATPARVIQTGASELALAGFEVAVADATGGILTAKRVRGPGGNSDYLTCGYAHNSIKDRSNNTSLTVSINARQGGDSSDVVVTTNVQSSYPSLTGVMAVAPNEKDCVSNGAIEKRVVDALKR